MGDEMSALRLYLSGTSRKDSSCSKDVEIGIRGGMVALVFFLFWFLSLFILFGLCLLFFIAGVRGKPREPPNLPILLLL